MRSIQQLVMYLNDYFAAETWKAAADFLGNLAVSQAADSVLNLSSLIHGLTNVEINFNRVPSVERASDNSIRIRLPGNERHQLKTDIVVDVLPDPELRADFLAEILARSTSPDININIDPNFSWGSTLTDIAMALISPQALLTKRALELSTEVMIRTVLDSQLHSQISGLETYRFDRTIDLTWQSNNGNPINLVRPNDRNPGPAAPGHIDILLVADGFSRDNLGEFTDFADEVAGHFNSPDLEVPFRNFNSAIRIWQMPLFVTDPDNPLQRSAVSFLDRSNRKMSFSNLARVAEIGLTARAAFGRDPIIVFTSKETEEVRANALGPYVLLDFTGDNTMARAILVHELGHTPLGRSLADEYSGDYPTYRGPEPAARNVSTNAFSAYSKWQPWAEGLQLPYIPPLASRLYEGAYMHDEGIFRFQEQCRMKNSTSGDFCPICREQLTLGMLDWAHHTVGHRGISGMVNVKIEYLRPWREDTILHITGGDAANLRVFSQPRGTDYPTYVRLTLKGSSVPEDWGVTWRIPNERYLGGGSREVYSSSVEIFAQPNTVVELSVRHNGSALPILSPQQVIPETRVSLIFDQERIPTSADLTPPSNLIQSVNLGSRLAIVIDSVNGNLSYSEDLWIAANRGRFRNYDLQTGLQFRIVGSGNFEMMSSPFTPSFWDAQGNQGSQSQFPLRGLLPGQYTWSVRTVWNTLTTNWIQAPRASTGYCFEIGEIPFEHGTRSPAQPFNLIISGTATVPSVPVGLEASSWHPNDKSIKFQFEVKKIDEPWNGQNLLETGFEVRDRLNYQTVAITGEVGLRLTVPSTYGFYKWRVRAVDPDNQMSGWVEGEQFAIRIPFNEPVRIDKWMEMIMKYEGRIFDLTGPRGPIESRESPYVIIADGTIPVGRRR